MSLEDNILAPTLIAYNTRQIFMGMRHFAEELDRKDPLRDFREQFIVPSKRDLVSKTLRRSCSFIF